LSVVLLTAGCATDVANRYYAAEKYPAKRRDEVALLYSAPTRPYEVIADFQSRGDTPESLQDRAAKIGADAIIVSKLGGSVPVGNEWASDGSYHDAFADRIVGTAIRYK
jgi:hypothetical protein